MTPLLSKLLRVFLIFFGAPDRQNSLGARICWAKHRFCVFVWVVFIPIPCSLLGPTTVSNTLSNLLEEIAYQSEYFKIYPNNLIDVFSFSGNICVVLPFKHLFLGDFFGSNSTVIELTRGDSSVSGTSESLFKVRILTRWAPTSYKWGPITPISRVK